MCIIKDPNDSCRVLHFITYAAKITTEISDAKKTFK